jgi:hypothetical protein
MLRQAVLDGVRTADIEPIRALTLKDINGRHLRRLVDLVGIEPTTSSMPWKRAPKLRHRPTDGQLFYCLRLQSNRQTAVRGSRMASGFERRHILMLVHEEEFAVSQALRFA